jgi:hypothetical protein
MWSHYADNHSGVCIGYKVHHVDNKIGLKFKKGTFLFLKIFVTVHGYWAGYTRAGDGLIPKYADKHSLR